MKSVNLIEVFSSFQGEGIDIGKRLLILRFKTCNRKCFWCDTLVKMRISAEMEISLEKIQNLIDEDKLYGPMITGGEPTFDKNFDQTVLLLNNLNYKLANVETNGYNLLGLLKKVDPTKKINYSYSPKIFNHKDFDLEMKQTENFIQYPNVYFKIVYEERDLLTQYLEFLSSLNINHRIFLMPEGVTREELFHSTPKVFDIAEQYKFNFSSREHIVYGFI